MSNLRAGEEAAAAEEKAHREGAVMNEEKREKPASVSAGEEKNETENPLGKPKSGEAHACSAPGGEASVRETIAANPDYKTQAAAILQIREPGLLLALAEDQNLSWPIRKLCLKNLFAPGTGSPEASATQDRAVWALLEAARTADGYDAARICDICRAIPRELHGKYGFSITEVGFDDQDIFGAYTSYKYFVTYGGIRYGRY